MYNDSNDSPVNDKSFLIDAQKLLDKHQPKDTDYLKKYYDVLEETNRTEFNNNIEKQLKVENSKDVANYDKLYEELKKFRLEKSRRENIKPYFIFNNKQLDHLIEIMPQNHTDLLKVNGFGEVKVEKYGDEILAIISNI
jgi:superfamily II DNA helicase RecQ